MEVPFICVISMRSPFEKPGGADSLLSFWHSFLIKIRWRMSQIIFLGKWDGLCLQQYAFISSTCCSVLGLDWDLLSTVMLLVCSGAPSWGLPCPLLSPDAALVHSEMVFCSLLSTQGNFSRGPVSTHTKVLHIGCPNRINSFLEDQIACIYIQLRVHTFLIWNSYTIIP